MKKEIQKGIVYIVLALIAFVLWFGAKECAHKKNIQTALEYRCKSLAGFVSCEVVDVPWFSPFGREYPCTGKVVLNGDAGEKSVDVTFTAKVAGVGEIVKDIAATASGNEVEEDWDVNLGFWGWIGDDYRIKNLQAK